MKAGPGLDALVDSKIMGFEHMTFERTPGQEPYPPTRIGFKRVPPYSTDIAAAWEVVNKLITDGVRLREGGQLHRQDFAVQFCGYDDERVWFAGWDGHSFTYGTTAPEAICLAALAALTQDRGALIAIAAHCVREVRRMDRARKDSS